MEVSFIPVARSFDWNLLKTSDVNAVSFWGLINSSRWLRAVTAVSSVFGARLASFSFSYRSRKSFHEMLLGFE